MAVEKIAGQAQNWQRHDFKKVVGRLKRILRVDEIVFCEVILIMILGHFVSAPAAFELAQPLVFRFSKAKTEGFIAILIEISPPASGFALRATTRQVARDTELFWTRIAKIHTDYFILFTSSFRSRHTHSLLRLAPAPCGHWLRREPA